MKAIQVIEPGKLKIIEKDIPSNIEDSEVLVKTKAAGICGSDIHIYHGTSPVATYPRVIGHEVVGEIVKIGKKVNDLKIGDRVILEPIEYCGKCYACKSNRPNVCENLKVRGVHSDGGFQEYFTAQSDKLHKLPDNLEWEKAVMIEPFSIGAQICYRGQIKENDLVMIYGAGPTGLSALENAKIIGAKCIIVDMNDKRLEFAKSFGADYVINPSTMNTKEELNIISNGSLANVVVDAVGKAFILEEAVSMTSVAGRIVCLGFEEAPARISPLEITKKEISIVGSRLQTHQFEKCIKLFADREINTTRLITHIYNFEDIFKAIDLIENEPEKVGKIILTFYPEELYEDDI